MMAEEKKISTVEEAENASENSVEAVAEEVATSEVTEAVTEEVAEAEAVEAVAEEAVEAEAVEAVAEEAVETEAAEAVAEEAVEAEAVEAVAEEAVEAEAVEAVAEEAVEAEAVEAVAEEAVEAEAVEAVAEEAVEAEAVEEVAEEAVEAEAVEAVAEENAETEVVAEQDEESEIEAKLKEAEDNIDRAKADARARRSEQDKTHKQTEAEAQSRIEETERKLQEDERLAQLVSEQKQAALDYAFNYRQKLMKDRQKAMTAAKLRERQEREAAEAAAREEKAKEIAALLEQERNEARERGEKATELLNRVTKCAIVDENGNLVLVDRLELAKGKLDDKADKAEETVEETADETVEETVEEAVAEVAKEPVKVSEPAPAPAEIPAEPTPVYGFSPEVVREENARREVEDYLAGEIVNDDDGRFVLNIEDERMIISLTSEDDSLISEVENAIPIENYSREVAIAEAQHKYIVDTIKANGAAAREQLRLIMEEEQRRFDHEITALMAHSKEIATLYAQRRGEVVDQISAIIGERIEMPEIDESQINVTRETEAAYAEAPATEAEEVAPAVDEATEEIEETATEAEDVCKLEPVVNEDPDVIALRIMGEHVKTKKQLKRYLKRSNKAVKRFNKQIKDYEEAAELADDKIHVRNAICHAIVDLGCVLEIRCDNLSCASRLGVKKTVRKYMDVLYTEIERYNRGATDFATVTGEQLTRVSAFLPEHLVAMTGKATIPVLGYRDRYEQYEDESKSAPASVTFSFPNLSGIGSGEGITVTPTITTNVKKKNEITVKTPVKAPLTEAELLGDTIKVTSKRKYKKLLKLAKKADKKLCRAAEKLKIENEAALSVYTLAIEREKVLVASRVLIGAVKLGILKHINIAKRALIEAFINYNALAERCSAACRIPVSTINSVTADKVAEHALLPDMPVMLHVVELYETVGDNTRVVGESGAEKMNTEDCLRFIFGGAAPEAKANGPVTAGATVGGVAVTNISVPAAAQPAAPAAAPAPVAAFAAQPAAASTPMAAPAAQPVAASAAEPTLAEAPAEKAENADTIEGKKLAKYKKQSDKNYKAAKDELESIEACKYGATVGEVADIDVKYLAAEKNLIDAIAEDIDVANRAGDKAFLRKSKKRLLTEIAAHNAAVDELCEISGASLSKVEKTLYDDIVSGGGYTKMSKLEYRVKESSKSTYIQSDSVDEEPVKKEFGSRANRAMKVMNKKELAKFLKSSDKAHDALKDELKKLSLQKKAAEEAEKVILLTKCLMVEKKAVAIAADKLTACCQVSTNKKQIESLKRDLQGEAAVYNSLVDEYTAFTGDSITRADVEMADKIMLGQPYSEIPEITYSIDTIVYEYKYANYVRGRVKEENAKILAKAQGHNRVEESNAAAYEVATLKSRVAAQANKDQKMIASRFMFEKGLLQSDDDMYTYAYGRLTSKEKSSVADIEKRCKQLDKRGKEAVAMERADNERYYKVITTDPNTVEIAKKRYSRADIISLRERIMQLLNERDRINGQLLSIYEGEEVDLDGRAITLEMRKVRSAAAAKEYKNQARNAKRVKRLSADSRDKKKLYDLLNTQIQAESSIALAKHRLKTEDLSQREIRNIKRDIANSKKSKQSAEKQFRWLFKRIAHYQKDAGGSWLMGLGFVLLILAALVVGFMMFFGPELWENVAKIFGK